MVGYNMRRQLHRRATFASLTRRVGSGVYPWLNMLGSLESLSLVIL
jgi:hypothetical protein